MKELKGEKSFTWKWKSFIFSTKNIGDLSQIQSEKKKHQFPKINLKSGQLKSVHVNFAKII